MKPTKYRTTILSLPLLAHCATASAFETFTDWMWSTFVGGYSHATSVKDGRIAEYGGDGFGRYSGRDYRILARGQKLNLTKGLLPGADPGFSGPNYNYGGPNCATSMSATIGAGGGHVAPYNLGAHFRFPQFGNWLYGQ